MNILAENFHSLNVDSTGLWHEMLPRGTSHALYLPLLFLFIRKNRQVRMASLSRRHTAFSKGNVLCVLPDRQKVAYVRGREDTYADEIRVLSARHLLEQLKGDSTFLDLCRSHPWWFVDCNDLLDGGIGDDITAMLLFRFGSGSRGEMLLKESRVRMPYVLIVHSASPASVTSAYPMLKGRTLEALIPPPANKFNVVVRNLHSVVECIAYVAYKINERSNHTGTGAFDGRGSSTGRGDCLVVTRSMEDALLTHSQLGVVLRECCFGAARLRLVGPVSITLGAQDSPGKRRFDSGVILSQTLDSYSSDRHPQYGLKNVNSVDLDRILKTTRGVGSNTDSSPVSAAVARSQTVYSSSYLTSTALSAGFPSSRDASSSLKSTDALPPLLEGRVYSTDLDPSPSNSEFTVFVTWGDWHYYSLSLWKLSMTFVFYLGTGMQKLSPSDKELKYSKFSSNAVGYRKDLLTLYSLGM